MDRAAVIAAAVTRKINVAGLGAKEIRQ